MMIKFLVRNYIVLRLNYRYVLSKMAKKFEYFLDQLFEHFFNQSFEYFVEQSKHYPYWWARPSIRIIGKFYHPLYGNHKNPIYWWVNCRGNKDRERKFWKRRIFKVMWYLFEMHIVNIKRTKWSFFRNPLYCKCQRKWCVYLRLLNR